MASISHDFSMEYDKEYHRKLSRLVEEMGFEKVEAQMALNDSNGNLDTAVEKLLSGQYNPPPYTPTDASITTPPLPAVPQLQANSTETKFSDSTTGSSVGGTHHVKTFFSDLLHRNKTPTFEDHPTAPSVWDIGETETSSKKNSMYPCLDDVRGLPPPYEKIQKSKLIDEWEKRENVIQVNIDFDLKNSQPVMPWGEDERCSSCFDPLVKENSKDVDMNDIVQQRRKYYHRSCFRKHHGPQCEYCYLPISEANKDHGLSGHYLKYQNKDYHVECYEKYAGPRCCQCFDVIIERPNGEFSGNWIVDGRKEFHLECYQKKMEIMTKKY